MKKLFVFLVILPQLLLAQNSTVMQSWNELGLGLKFDKRQSVGLNLTTRFDVTGLQTIFPQVSYKYKVNKYFRPSLDYRLIGNRSQEGNYILQHRLNANLQFNHQIQKFDLGLRVRYQFSSSRFGQSFEPEFNDAFRFKPEIAYNLSNSKLTPSCGMELFYNPMNGQNGYQLNRIRWNVGVSIDLDKAGELEVGYLYDQRINVPGALNRAILNIGYSYTLDAKDFKKKSKGKNPKSL
jgi:hypothetical protein